MADHLLYPSDLNITGHGPFVVCVLGGESLRCQITGYGPLFRFLPRLREVSLSFRYQYYHHFVNGLSRLFFCDAVDLRRLKISCPTDEIIMPGGLVVLGEAPGIPWTQLTELCLSIYHSFESALQILRLCPCLEACTISLRDHTAVPIVEMLTLPYIKSLTIYEISFPEDTILNNLVAPSLVKLRLFLDDPGTFSRILSFLHRSEASLEVFWCINLFSYRDLYRTPGVEGFLEQVPTLLEIQTPILFPISVLQRVSRGELLPRLEIWRCGLLLDTVDAFIDAVEARLVPEISASQVLRKACGRIFIEAGTSDVRGALQRMEKVREEYGDDFKLLVLDDESLA
ncbi:hypothetical protein Hypma_012100 [Hypsizygus marmoreus]|uniref:F-box domain-containing protein n=1 Tax=Hypsizygus marmoreus TaxID=39966 RepID=A0A369JES1_HYPMA|nr:hypothetical protein Hypma_012100 [Hypsizygus marmoreus]